MTDIYSQQRAMRAMREAAMQRGVIAILDIGSAKVGCLVLRFDGPDQFRDSDGVGSLAGQSAFRVIGAATTPVARGPLWRDRRHGRDRARHPHCSAGRAEDGEPAC